MPDRADEGLPFVGDRQGLRIDQDGADLDDLGLLAWDRVPIVTRGLEIDDEVMSWRHDQMEPTWGFEPQTC
jgi:hypothetical protein